VLFVQQPVFAIAAAALYSRKPVCWLEGPPNYAPDEASPGQRELNLARAFGANLGWAADGRPDGLAGKVNWCVRTVANLVGPEYDSQSTGAVRADHRVKHNVACRRPNASRSSNAKV
jgi:hypothetical protein